MSDGNRAGFICWFDEAKSKDPSLVGGKAANLGLLASGGFNVPAGFTVTTAAYSAFLHSVDGLEEEIGRRLEAVSYAEIDSVDAASSTIRTMIRQAPIPDGMAK